jgi:hypothetical protein
LSTKLSGIPEEYFDYLLAIESDGAEGIADAIRRVCRMSEDERLALGEAGRAFVMTHKSIEVQGKRLAEFLDRMKSKK